jgi:hypothetical protein
VGANVNISHMLGNQHESTIAIDPANPKWMFAASNLEAPGILGAYSKDGGVTWTEAVHPGGLSDIGAVWDSYGNLYLTYLTQRYLYVEMEVSTDGGATFKALPPLSGRFSDRPSVAAGAGSVWVCYTDPTNNVVAVGAPVTGLGQFGTFSSYVVPGSTNGDFGNIAIGPSGQVMVTYQYGLASGAGPDTIVVNEDPAGIRGTFGGPVVVTTTQVGGDHFIPAQSNNLGIDAEANLAWDRSGGPHNGRVYLVYTDAPSPASTATGIYTRYSDNNGTTWSNGLRVTDDIGSNSKFLPSIAVDQTSGAVGVAWYDCRNDLGNRGPGDTNGIPNDDAQLWATFSSDGGVSFLPNVQVSAGTSNAADSEPPPAGYRPLGYGDYSKCDFYGGQFFRIWADNSNSTGDNPGGTLHTMNVYTAPVTVSFVATPTVTVTGGPFTYDGTAHAASATATGAGGVSVGGAFTFTYNGLAAVPVDAGTYAVVATFTSSDPNYSNATGTGSITINPATPTVVVSGGPCTYDGTAHAAGATAFSVDSVTAVNGSFTFTYNGSAAAPTNAGNYAVVATFTSSDSNYTGATGTGSIFVNPATPVFTNLSSPTIKKGTASVTVSGNLAAGSVFPTGHMVSVTLNGVTHTAGVDAAGNFSVSFTTSKLAGGSYPITYAFAGDGANFGPATNGTGTLTVATPPRVTLNPKSQTVAPGASVTFTAAASGFPTPAIQWQVSTDGGKTYTNIAGATSTTLTFTATAAQNHYRYRAVFSNAVGIATTAAATLTVQYAPTVTLSPSDRTVAPGHWVTFKAAATGNPKPTVQWQVSTDGGATWTDICGATSTTLSFIASAGDNGNKYRAVFTNVVGTATTTAATLTV